ncbi:MAG: hypothetical protein ABSG33_03320 [Candidatus Bathyarchaeia archaeon]
MDKKESLLNRIRGWFPQEPLLKKAFHVQSKPTKTVLPPSSWESTSTFVAYYFLAALFAWEFLVMNDNPLGWVFVVGGYALASGNWAACIYRLNRWHLLDWDYLKVLFGTSAVIIVTANVLFAFTLLNSVNYWIISAVDISIFTALFALRGRVVGVGKTALRRKMSVLFALAGIILLVCSMSQVYHVEAKLTPVGHFASIVPENPFILNQSIPDVEVAQNLTTNNYVDFEIIVARLYAHQTEVSGVSVQVTNQSASASSTPETYFYYNSFTNGSSIYWQPPQNGTYYFRLHYDYVVPVQMDVSISYSWSTNEMLPTKVYNPLLSEFMTPTLILAVALLAASLAFSIRRTRETIASKPPSKFGSSLWS